MVSSSRGLMARYREDLSYRPSPVDLGKARYCRRSFMERVKPGYREDYEEAIKMDVAAYGKAADQPTRSWIAYSGRAAGSSGGLYLYFVPMSSLAESDHRQRGGSTARQWEREAGPDRPRSTGRPSSLPSFNSLR